MLIFAKSERVFSGKQLFKLVADEETASKYIQIHS